ncbi:nucleophile aminohydrolase [Tribonema minus]|uniref:Nucleophile aminohydrolase n=1 Tax=Tribonema minus TaxID=303371 RepID=A0A836C917_9STRA|nr:nucleophile aminohydrolase [Tribonema minus]
MGGSGYAADVTYQAELLRHLALKFKQTMGYVIPGKLLAKDAADLAQAPTQGGKHRPLGCSCFLAYVGGEGESPMLTRIDPTGQSFDLWAGTAGRGMGSASNWLQKKFESQAAQGQQVGAWEGDWKECARLCVCCITKATLSAMGSAKHAHSSVKLKPLTADTLEVLVWEHGSAAPRLCSAEEREELLQQAQSLLGEDG